MLSIWIFTVWSDRDRALPAVTFAVTVFLGPVLSPIVSGALFQKHLDQSHLPSLKTTSLVFFPRLHGSLHFHLAKHLLPTNRHFSFRLSRQRVHLSRDVLAGDREKEGDRL